LICLPVCINYLPVCVTAEKYYTQGYYKRNRQFQHFIKHKLFKIPTLTMHGFVEKLWKFVTATYRCSMFAPLVTRHILAR
jgi:hypothetical protein